MRNDLGHAWDRAYKAIRSLIVGRGTIQDRLYHGYTTLGGPDTYELSDEHILSEWEEIVKECTKGNPSSSYQDHVQATIYSMSDDDAAEMGSRIFSLYISIEEALIESRRQLQELANSRSQFTEDDVIQNLSKVDGVSEVRQVVSTFKLYRTKNDGQHQNVTVDILDAGPNADQSRRFSCFATADDGATATGNPDSSIEMALMHMHWEHLDYPAPNSTEDDSKRLM